MIWIRADANKEIGTGHVMRCLSVAAALKQLGEQVCFLVADENPVPLIEGKGQEYKILHSDYRNPEGELEKLEELLRENAPGFLLADSYFITAEYFRRVREYVPVGYVDDKCLAGFPLDVLINYNIFADEALYAGQYDDARLLLGTKYAPLREEFVGSDYQVREKVSRVLVTTGGSDKYNLAGQLLEKALSRPDTAKLEYCVISGAYNEHLDKLKELESQHSNVQIQSNVKNMSRLMRGSDIAVTAGGSTMYELSAIGVPIICFSFVDNQERIVEGFRKNGMVCFGGNYLLQGENMLDEAIEQIAMLSGNGELRRAYSAKQRKVVDGRGAMRIAQVLAEFAQPDWSRE